MRPTDGSPWHTSECAIARDQMRHLRWRWSGKESEALAALVPFARQPGEICRDAPCLREPPQPSASNPQGVETRAAVRTAYEWFRMWMPAPGRGPCGQDCSAGIRGLANRPLA